MKKRSRAEHTPPLQRQREPTRGWRKLKRKSCSASSRKNRPVCKLHPGPEGYPANASSSPPMRPFAPLRPFAPRNDCNGPPRERQRFLPLEEPAKTR